MMQNLERTPLWHDTSSNTFLAKLFIFNYYQLHSPSSVSYTQLLLWWSQRHEESFSLSLKSSLLLCVSSRSLVLEMSYSHFNEELCLLCKRLGVCT